MASIRHPIRVRVRVRVRLKETLQGPRLGTPNPLSLSALRWCYVVDRSMIIAERA